MSGLDELRNALASHPEDAAAAVALAHALLRRGEPDEARARLLACERACCPVPGAERRSADALRSLRSARFDLGLFVHEQARADELLSWPARAISDVCWRLAPAGNRRWSLAAALASASRLVVVATDPAHKDGLLCAVDLAHGKLAWQRPLPGRLVDLHAQGGDELIVLCDEPAPASGLVIEWLSPAHGTVLAQHRVADCYAKPFLELDDELVLLRRVEESGSLREWLDAPRLLSLGPSGSLQRAAGGLGEPAKALACALHCLPSRPQDELVELVFGARPEVRSVYFQAASRGAFLSALDRERGVRILQLRGCKRALLSCPDVFAASPSSSLRPRARAPRSPLIALPRLHRVACGWLGNVLSFDSNQRGAAGPGKRLQSSPRQIWLVRDDAEGLAQAVELVELGHPEASQAVIAGGVWMALRSAPPRLLAYTVQAGAPMALYQTRIDDAESAPIFVPPWQLEPAPVSRAMLPLGGLIVSVEGRELRARRLS